MYTANYLPKKVTFGSLILMPSWNAISLEQSSIHEVEIGEDGVGWQ